MGGVRMARLAGQVALNLRYRNGASRDLVSPGKVAVDAAQVIPTGGHMNIKVAIRQQKCSVDTTVPDGILDPTGEVAGHAAGRPAHLAHPLRHLDQVNTILRQTPIYLRLFIGIGGIVANQTIYLVHVTEVKILVPPTIAGVTDRTPWPITVQSNAAVAHGPKSFTQIRAHFISPSKRRRTLPVPMNRLEHVLALNLVAGETVLGHSKDVDLTLQLNQLPVVGNFPFMTRNTVQGGAVHQTLSGLYASDSEAVLRRTLSLRFLGRPPVAVET